MCMTMFVYNHVVNGCEDFLFVQNEDWDVFCIFIHVKMSYFDESIAFGDFVNYL